MAEPDSRCVKDAPNWAPSFAPREGLRQGRKCRRGQVARNNRMGSPDGSLQTAQSASLGKSYPKWHCLQGPFGGLYKSATFINIFYPNGIKPETLSLQGFTTCRSSKSYTVYL